MLQPDVSSDSSSSGISLTSSNLPSKKSAVAQADFSASEARRIALAAQGFDCARCSGRVGLNDLRRTIRKLGLLQIDYFNVLAPAQYHVLFSRLGPYKRSLLDDLVYRRREFTEHWAHEASIVPVESWPLLRHRMAAHRVRPYHFEKFMAEQPEYVEWVLDQVRQRGPLSGGDLAEPAGIARRLEKCWVGTVPRAVLEAHFGRGTLAVADRRPDFTRVYDLAERIIPARHTAEDVAREDAQRGLLRIACRGYGIATAPDLADYFRMPVRDARPRIDELVQLGELREVRVEGWRQLAYLDPNAKLPTGIESASLLSPFDPVIWFRARVARLFEFEYRVEIFVPQPKRRWGVYVLPFLMGEHLVARVDLKASRADRRLVVAAAYREPHAKPGPVAEALASELKTLAGWLELDSVAVEPRGDFAGPLAAASFAGAQLAHGPRSSLFNRRG